MLEERGEEGVDSPRDDCKNKGGLKEGGHGSSDMERGGVEKVITYTVSCL